MSLLPLISLLVLACPLVIAGNMEVLYSWSHIDYIFPSESLREVYLASAQFIPKHNVILDVDVWSESANDARKVFVTIPKFKPGIPVTLATVSDQRRNDTTLLKPYPDWSWHQGDCDGITSVYRTTIDECGRLWVVDTGSVESFVQYKRACPPQLLVFDLKTDKLIKRYRFPDSLLDAKTQMITIVVDTRDDDCSSSFAYIADVNEFNLYVYNFAKDEAWKITNNLFYPYPFHGDFHINGVDFELMDGIFGLALGSVKRDGDRTLYFHSFASVYESWVSTSVIRNSSLFEHNAEASPRSFHVFEGSRTSQAAVEAMTDSGILLYTMAKENAIGCWNSKMPFLAANLDTIAKDDESLQFQSGLKVYGNYVWTVSNRLQEYIAHGELDEDEVNLRINVGRISDLLKNTKCNSKIPFIDSSLLVFPSSRPPHHSQSSHSFHP